jgi:hypothetical protein
VAVGRRGRGARLGRGLRPLAASSTRICIRWIAVRPAGA